MKTKLVIITNSKHTAEEVASSACYYDSDLDKEFLFDEVVEEIMSRSEIKELDIEAVKAKYPSSTIIVEHRYVLVAGEAHDLEDMSNKDWFALIEKIKHRPYDKRSVTFVIDNEIISQMARTSESFYASGTLYLMGKEIQKKNFNIFDYLSKPQHPRIAVGGDASNLRRHTGYTYYSEHINKDIEIAVEHQRIVELIEKDPVALAREIVGLRHLVEKLESELDSARESARDRYYDEFY